MVTFVGGNVPLPAKCSAQLQRLVQEHSANLPPPRILDSTMEQLKELSQTQKDCHKINSDIDKDVPEECCAQATATNSFGSENIPILNQGSSFPPHSNNDTRPIYPHLPYSPYGSPTTSPRVRRKPLRETTRVNSINSETGEFVQLNQYKVEGAIGQVTFT
jgi:hypothetical protein